MIAAIGGLSTCIGQICVSGGYPLRSAHIVPHSARRFRLTAHLALTRCAQVNRCGNARECQAAVAFGRSSSTAMISAVTASMSAMPSTLWSRPLAA